MGLSHNNETKKEKRKEQKSGKENREESIRRYFQNDIQRVRKEENAGEGQMKENTQTERNKNRVYSRSLNYFVKSSSHFFYLLL